MVIDHGHPCYRARWQNAGHNRFNGAFYYSKEIVRNIIPNVETDRNWITVNIPQNNHIPQFYSLGSDHSIVFIHNNLHPENYEWLSMYDDLVLVCGLHETCDKVSHLGKAIFLPLSIDVEDVQRHIRPKTKEVAFVGRKVKRKGIDFPPDVNIIEGLPREQLLETMAEYKKIYAVGRTAIEAKALGCEVLPYDERFPDASIWRVLDNKDAAKILQEKLNEIDN
jgi:hypothetical protein